MTERKKNLFKTPLGTEGFYFEEALIHRQMMKKITGLFELWGYLPAQTPVFDFFDTYDKLLSPAQKDSVYRLFDREGDLLMLRSDITLFLARQMGLLLKESDLPVRVSYADSILRHQNKEDLSKNEFFQAGAELIGKAGSDADLEIIMLLIKTLEAAGLNDFRIHIGSKSIFTAFFGGLTDIDKNRLSQAVLKREKDIFCSLTEKLLPEENPELLTGLFFFMGSCSAASDLLSGLSAKIKNTHALQTADTLLKTARILETLNEADRIVLDFSELGQQSYYTGIVFQAYAEGLDSAAASGGRYDGLLKNFGFDAPSAGFSVFLRKIQNLQDAALNAEAGHDFIRLNEKNFISAYKKAEELRKKGKTALL